MTVLPPLEPTPWRRFCRRSGKTQRVATHVPNRSSRRQPRRRAILPVTPDPLGFRASITVPLPRLTPWHTFCHLSHKTRKGGPRRPNRPSVRQRWLRAIPSVTPNLSGYRALSTVPPSRRPTPWQTCCHLGKTGRGTPSMSNRPSIRQPPRGRAIPPVTRDPSSFQASSPVQLSRRPTPWQKCHPRQPTPARR